MGEAFYYLKGDNCTEGAFEQITEFIKEGCNSEDFWQESRGIYNNTKKLKQDVFWKQCTERFPMVTKYLKFIKKYGGDSNNSLAGYLDFGREDDLDHLEFDADYTDEDGIVVGRIKYNAMVWHCADWDGFTAFLQKEFGLKNVRWLSDEHIDPYDAL